MFFHINFCTGYTGHLFTHDLFQGHLAFSVRSLEYKLSTWLNSDLTALLMLWRLPRTSQLFSLSWDLFQSGVLTWNLVHLLSALLHLLSSAAMLRPFCLKASIAAWTCIKSFGFIYFHMDTLNSTLPDSVSFMEFCITYCQLIMNDIPLGLT